MSDEIPDGLIHDDLLEERLCRKMQNLLKRVYIHHKVISFLEISGGLIFCIDGLIITCLVMTVQKIAQCSRIKSSTLAVKSELLQQVPALK